jgi:hypothetical protein
VGAVQIEIIELLDSGIIQIDVNHRVLVRGLQYAYGRAKRKQAVKALRVPGFKHPCERDEEDLCGQERSKD